MDSGSESTLLLETGPKDVFTVGVATRHGLYMALLLDLETSDSQG